MHFLSIPSLCYLSFNGFPLDFLTSLTSQKEFLGPIAELFLIFSDVFLFVLFFFEVFQAF